MPQSGRRWFPFKNWIRRIEAETTPPHDKFAHALHSSVHEREMNLRSRLSRTRKDDLPGCPRHQPGICGRTGTASPTDSTQYQGNTGLRSFPIHLVHREQGSLPLKTRRFLDYCVPRLRAALADLLSADAAVLTGDLSSS